MSGSVLCVVQARMGSTRRPGKVLADLDGRPLLGFMLDRLQPLAVAKLVVATSDLPADDAVASVAESAGVTAVRGPEADVLGRFALALNAFPADLVVRLTADCPLMDPALVVATIDMLVSAGADYASNTLVRTYPDGLDVEVMTAAALRAAAAEADQPAEREHVTPFIYRRTDRFRLAAVRNDAPLGDERWTVDTEEDLASLREIVSRLGDRTAFGWRDVLAVAPRLAADRVRLEPAAESMPAARVWVAFDGAAILARPSLSLGDPTSYVDLNLTPAGAARAGKVRDLVSAALARDCQVQEAAYR